MSIKKIKKKLGSKRLKNVLHISERDGYVYVSNPKATCFTIKLYLSRCQMKNHEFRPQSLHRRRYLPFGTIDNVTDDEIHRVLNGKYYLFSFVRHPLKRALSAYGDKIAGIRKQKIEILKYLGKSAADIRDSISFDEFVRVISRQKPASLNPHWRPQFFNLYPNIINYYIGHIERFKDDIETVRTRLNLPASPIPRKNVKARAINPSVFWTPINRFRLARLYAKDFIEFGYRPIGIEWLGVFMRNPLSIGTLKLRRRRLHL